ncbi:MAG TPA: antibiotic biosynthesis monooxygenase [Bacteroidota bacterium]|nr:antibiotic biosynthesis monooxygenase [Bacteroidota bacterium]
MWRPFTMLLSLPGIQFVVAAVLRRPTAERDASALPHYLRMSVARWHMNLYTPEAEAIFRRIATEGVAVFRAQPGFVRYRLMRADSTTTIAVAEWESEQLGKAGAEKYRAWMRGAGIMDHFKLETQAGDIVAGS